MNESFSLTYLNEDDRAYGLAGMAIAVASLDALNKIAEVCLDSDGPMVDFMGTYYYTGSPAVSPKTTWNTLLSNFHLTAAMAVGNVMARALVRLQQEVPDEVMRQLHDTIAEEGRDTCGLDDEEVDILFNRVMARFKRIFYNPRVNPVVSELASVLSQRRRMTGLELSEELVRLEM